MEKITILGTKKYEEITHRTKTGKIFVIFFALRYN